MNTIIQTDLDLVRGMSRFQQKLAAPFDTWPEWAKEDAQRIADYRVHCVAVAQIEHRLGASRRHVFWYAGQPDCPKELKAPNGELHTLKCKVCGEESPRSPACFGVR